MDDVAEEDEIGKFYSHEDRADIVQEKEEETPQQNLFPDQVNPTSEHDQYLPSLCHKSNNISNISFEKVPCRCKVQYPAGVAQVFVEVSLNLNCVGKHGVYPLS